MTPMPNRSTRATLLIVLLLTLGVSAAKHPQPTPTGISLSPATWDVRYSSGVKLQALSGMAGWLFLFPTAPGHVNYITVPFKTPIVQGQSVTFTAQVVTVSGVPVFEYGLGPDNPCVNPAHVRAYIEQDYPKNGRFGDITYAPATYRWWANPIAVEIVPGTATVTVPIQPDQWSDTDGQFGTTEPDGFAAAVAHPAAVGLTFGGGCFAGHGVWLSGGSARFILTSFAIQ